MYYATAQGPVLLPPAVGQAMYQSPASVSSSPYVQLTPDQSTLQSIQVRLTDVTLCRLQLGDIFKFFQSDSGLGKGFPDQWHRIGLLTKCTLLMILANILMSFIPGMWAMKKYENPINVIYLCHGWQFQKGAELVRTRKKRNWQCKGRKQTDPSCCSYKYSIQKMKTWIKLEIKDSISWSSRWFLWSQNVCCGSLS